MEHTMSYIFFAAVVLYVAILWLKGLPSSSGRGIHRMQGN